MSISSLDIKRVDDWQRLPSILAADAVVKSDDTMMPDIACDKITAVVFLVDFLIWLITR